MLTRLAIKNYRCLDNLAIELSNEALLVGYNGTGKSSVLDALRLLQSFILGRRALKDLISASDATIWTTREVIEIEVELNVEGQLISYQLIIRVPRFHRGAAPSAQDVEPSVLEEHLSVGRVKMVSREATKVKFKTSIKDDVGMEFPWPATQSILAAFDGPGDSPYHAFKSAVQKWILVRPNAPIMRGESLEPSRMPSKSLTDPVGWYQHLAQNGKWLSEFNGFLKDIWEDFEYLRLDTVGKRSNILALHFENESYPEINLTFEQLSDGERTLFVLYMIVALIRTEDGYSVFIDEPDNFIALTEVQPWLREALDSVEATDQLVIASHHPEIADLMGEDRTLYLSRGDHGSGTQIRKLPKMDDGLTFSQRINRGFVDA